MFLKTLDQVDLKDKTVLIRTDLNVTMRDNQILDTTRIDLVIPTLHRIHRQGGKIILIAHRGRPKGKVIPELTLKPIFEYLKSKLPFTCVFSDPENLLQKNKNRDTDLIFLENIRFQAGEEENDSVLAQRLASLADVYVNDAFSVSHRAHASVEAITHFLPSFAGYLMEREVTMLSKVLNAPEKPVLAILGGAKVSTKIGLIENLIEKADILWVIGGLAHTAIAAKGYGAGKDSLVEDSFIPVMKELPTKYPEKLRIPGDFRVAPRVDPTSAVHEVADFQIPSDQIIVDMGSLSLRALKEDILAAQTIIWNGAAGIFEIPPFSTGTFEIAKTMATAPGFTIAGGGETLTSIHMAGCSESDFGYLSTAGGAFLEFLEGKTLPGVQALVKIS